MVVRDAAPVPQVRLDWGALTPFVRHAAPRAALPVFDGGRLLVYALLDGDCPTEATVTVTAGGPDGDVSFSLAASPAPATETSPRVLHVSAARAVLRDMASFSTPASAERVRCRAVAVARARDAPRGVTVAPAAGNGHRAEVQPNVAVDVLCRRRGFGGGRGGRRH